ncbi:MAG: hypothetical protein EXX96DRAFT_614912 [Benjaminiella poitrasii]|nr:MAG: hypothetical protein EXX96DRAFT_614912 [Benjaminiella poitrasii]
MRPPSAWSTVGTPAIVTTKSTKATSHTILGAICAMGVVDIELRVIEKRKHRKIEGGRKRKQTPDPKRLKGITTRHYLDEMDKNLLVNLASSPRVALKPTETVHDKSQVPYLTKPYSMVLAVIVLLTYAIGGTFSFMDKHGLVGLLQHYDRQDHTVGLCKVWNLAFIVNSLRRLERHPW